MDKVEWDAMDRMDKNILCNRLLGSPVEPDDLSGWWRYEDREERLQDFVGDRNACSLVLDELEERDMEFVFARILTNELNIMATGGLNDFAISVLRTLNADPDLICYCAIKALE